MMFGSGHLWAWFTLFSLSFCVITYFQKEKFGHIRHNIDSDENSQSCLIFAKICLFSYT